MSRDVRDAGRGNGRHSSSIVRKGFIGQASSSGGLRGGELPVRDFFISRVHKDDGVQQLRDFLQTNDIAVRDVVLRSYADAKFNSFKLSVSADDADI